MSKINLDLREIGERSSEVVNSLESLIEMIKKDERIREKTKEWIESIESDLHDAIAELIIEIVVRELKPDVDISKYGIESAGGIRKIIGVVMVKENESIKPVAIWTDYNRVWYSEIASN
jgi:hypothetical protein